MGCVTDSFTRADSTGLGTADSSEIWTPQDTGTYDGSGSPIAAVASQINVVSNKAKSPDATHLQIATIDHGFANGSFQAACHLPPVGEGTGVVLRWQDATHYWLYLLFRSLSGNYTVFLRKQNGAGAAYSDVVSALTVTPTNPDPVMRAVVKGNDFHLYLDTQGLTTVTDASYNTATKHGLFTYFSATDTVDDYSGCPSTAGWTVGAVRIG